METTIRTITRILLLAVVAAVAILGSSAAVASASEGGEGGILEEQCVEGGGMYERTDNDGTDVEGCYDPDDGTSTECSWSDRKDRPYTHCSLNFMKPGPDGTHADSTAVPTGTVHEPPPQVLVGSVAAPSEVGALSSSTASSDPLPRYMGTSTLIERCSADGGLVAIGFRIAECKVHGTAIWKCVKIGTFGGEALWLCGPTGNTPTLTAQASTAHSATGTARS